VPAMGNAAGDAGRSDDGGQGGHQADDGERHGNSQAPGLNRIRRALLTFISFSQRGAFLRQLLFCFVINKLIFGRIGVLAPSKNP